MKKSSMTIKELKAIYPMPGSRGESSINPPHKGYKHTHKPVWLPGKPDMSPAEYKRTRRAQPKNKVKAHPLETGRYRRRPKPAVRESAEETRATNLSKAIKFAGELIGIVVPKKTVLISLMKSHRVNLTDARSIYRSARLGALKKVKA